MCLCFFVMSVVLFVCGDCVEECCVEVFGLCVVLMG